MIRVMRLAVLYIALGLGANTAMAEELDHLLQGDMRVMMLPDAPVDPGPVSFTDIDGVEMGLEAFAGQYVVLNFWATWCAPCRVEMPSLAALQQVMGSSEFAVVTVATGRNPVPAINRFLDEVGASSLRVVLDPSQDMARAMDVTGLPTTVLLDPEGREAGRLVGDADWAGDEALALLSAWSGQGES
jgi:thiol-disulfide isomerase/thioredoxin